MTFLKTGRRGFSDGLKSRRRSSLKKGRQNCKRQAAGKQKPPLAAAGGSGII
jgi:hypothetical protein